MSTVIADTGVVQPRATRRRRATYVTVFVLAVVVRLAFLVGCGGLDQRLHDSEGDQRVYLDLARHLSAGRGFVVGADIWVAHKDVPTSIVPPLYPVLLGLVFSAVGDNLAIVRLLQVVLSALVVVLVMRIGERAFDWRTAVWAGLATAAYPTYVMYVRPIMSEALFLPLLAALVYVSYELATPRRADGRLAWFALWGALSALAMLTRTEALLLSVILGAYIAWRHHTHGSRRWIPGLGLGLLVLGLLVLPYAIYNQSAHGRFSPLPNARWKFWDHTWWAEMRKRPEWAGVVLPERLVVPHWETLVEIERDRYLGNMAVSFVAARPLTFAAQRATHLMNAYPVLPMEVLRPARRPDGADVGPTSLDDDVRYATTAERLRVWPFRCLVLALLVAAMTGWYRGRTGAVLLWLVLLWNVVHVTLLVGNERLRMQSDFCLILLAIAYGVSAARKALDLPPASD